MTPALAGSRVKDGAIVVVLCLTLSGCGFMITRAPPPNHERMINFSCTEDNVAPRLDVAMGTLLAVAGLTARRQWTTQAPIGVAEGIFYGWSALRGFKKSRECRRAKRLLAEREALFDRTHRIISVVVNPAADTLTIGRRVQLIATGYNSIRGEVVEGEFDWSSSDSTVASVNNAGLVTARTAGSATITAWAGDVAGSSSIMVMAPGQ